MNTLTRNADKTISAAHAAGMTDAGLLRLLAQIIIRLEPPDHLHPLGNGGTAPETFRPLIMSALALAPTPERIAALSPAARAWLARTMERFAENEPYDYSVPEMRECLAAGLIARAGQLGQIELAPGMTGHQTTPPP